MIIFYCAAVAFVVMAVILRGRISNLAQLQLRHVWLVWAALLTQVLIITVIPTHSHRVVAAIHVATYAAAGAFAWLNRKIAGAAPIFLGGGLNVVAILANGGTMPASRRALVASGWHPRGGRFANSAVVPDAHVRFLGDVFATPSWLPGHDVFSLGDVFIVIGIVLVMWRACAPASRLTRSEKSLSLTLVATFTASMLALAAS